MKLGLAAGLSIVGVVSIGLCAVKDARADFSQLSVSGPSKGISFVGDKVGYSFTQDVFNVVQLEKTTDGLTFKSVASTGIPSSAIYNGLKFVDENTGFITAGVAPGASCIYKTSDGGKTWAAKSCGVTGSLRVAYSSQGISFSSTKLGVLVGVLDLTKPYVGITTDGGETWKPITTTMPFLSAGSAAILSPTHLLVTGNYDAGGGTLVNASYLTRDGGATWKKVRDGVAIGAGTYDFLSDTTGYLWSGCTGAGAATNSCVVKTTDGGDTWTVPSTAFIPINIAAMAWADATHGMLSGGEISPATGPAVMLTSDGGKTWTKERVPVQSDGYVGAAYPGPSAYAGSSAKGAKGGVNGAAGGGPRPPLVDPGTTDAGVDSGGTDAATDSAVTDSSTTDSAVADSSVADSSVTDSGSTVDSGAGADSGADSAAPPADPGSSGGCSYDASSRSDATAFGLAGLLGLLGLRARRGRAQPRSETNRS